MFHQNHGRNSVFSESYMVVDDNLLNLNSGRKSSRSPGRNELVDLNKTDSATYLKNPAWPRTDFTPNLSEY